LNHLFPTHKCSKRYWFWQRNKNYSRIQRAFLEREKSNAGFIFTNEQVPTWWTQLPVDNSILTGWLGGEKANSLKDNTEKKYCR
jgi:hypothetical protein